MKKKKNIFDSIFPKVTSILATLAMVIAISMQLTNFNGSNQKDFRERSQNTEILADSLSIIMAEQLLIKEQIQELTKDSLPNNALFNNKISALNLRISKIEEQTKGLREAINPLNPEEVLTIARLNDGLKNIETKQKSLSIDIEGKFESFKTSVIRELDASSKSINWLFLVLIPLVMNLLYSMWQERKKKNESKE